jgi:hypothetical protein
MRNLFLAFAILAAASSLVFADDHRRPPAPDDLLDPGLIDLDLTAIVAEEERLWSVSFGVGSSQQGLATTETQAEHIMTMKAGFDSLANYFEDAAGITIRWRSDAFEDMRPVLDLQAAVRYKLPDKFTLPGVGARLGVELTGGRMGTATRFSDCGFAASLADEAWVLGGRALVYLPTSLTLTRFRPFKGVEKRDVYVGFGAGRAWARHSIEIYMPDDQLQGIGDFYHYQATGSGNTYEFMAGADEYFTPSLSLNLQVGYRWLEKGGLEYTDPEKIENSSILIDEGKVATVWGPWFPEGMIPFVAAAAGLNSGWDRGTEEIKVDFSGFVFRGGLRYHF